MIVNVTADKSLILSLYFKFLRHKSRTNTFRANRFEYLNELSPEPLIERNVNERVAHVVEEVEERQSPVDDVEPDENRDDVGEQAAQRDGQEDLHDGHVVLATRNSSGSILETVCTRALQLADYPH